MRVVEGALLLQINFSPSIFPCVQSARFGHYFIVASLVV